MTDCIIDTNVLLVASAMDATSPFDDSEHVSPKTKQLAFDWLLAFRDAPGRNLVLDQAFQIWNEYHNKLGHGQDLGSLVVTDKLQKSAVRFVDVEFDKNGHACVPRDLAEIIHDRSDRKFVAAALADLANGDECVIVNAVDGDWCLWMGALADRGVKVEQLVPGFCDGLPATE